MSPYVDTPEPRDGITTRQVVAVVLGMAVVAVFVAMANGEPRDPSPDFRDDSSEPVIVPDPTFPRPFR